MENFWTFECVGLVCGVRKAHITIETKETVSVSDSDQVLPAHFVTLLARTDSAAARTVEQALVSGELDVNVPCFFLLLYF